MENKILIIGCFSKDQKKIGGEYSKSKNVYEYLEKNLEKYDVSYFNYLDYRYREISLYFILKKKCSGIHTFLIMPSGEKGLLTLSLFFHIYSKKHKFRIFYPVVGGWLAESIKKYHFLKKWLFSYNGFFCETKGFCMKLENLEMKNVFYSPVFSERTPLSKNDFLQSFDIIKNSQNEFHFCTFSRISADKGVSLAAEAIIRINKSGLCSKPVTLDVFGVFDNPKYQKYFLHLCKKSNGSVKYGGFIPDDLVISTLSNYYACLFPTYFWGEGFPASVLEALMSGIPVIASDWKYNSEIVIDKNNGLLFSLDDPDGLYKSIKWLILNKSEALKMRFNAIKCSKNFSKEKAMEPLLNIIRSTPNKTTHTSF